MSTQYSLDHPLSHGILMNKTGHRHPLFFIAYLLVTAFILISNSGVYAAADRHTLRIRGDRNYPPFEFIDELGIPDGYNMDIMTAVARVMNLDISISLGPWDDVRRELEEGKIDALMGMYKTAERDRLVDFSVPHLVVSYSIFVRDDSPDIHSIDDLKGKTIIVQKDDLGHDFLTEQNITERIILERDWANTLQSLSRGKGDCAIVSRLQGMRLITNLSLKNIHAVGPPLLQRSYCIAVHEGRRDLLAQINEGLSILKTTGEYDRIYEKWFGIYEERPLRQYMKYIFWVLIPLVIVAFMGYLWSWTLRKQVTAHTGALRESEEKFRLIAEQTMLGIIIIQDEMIKYVNRAIAEINEYSIEEMLAWKAQDYLKSVHPDDVQKVIDHSRRTQTSVNAPAASDEWRLISRSGRTKWIAVYSRSINYTGRPADLSAVVDITENKRMQELMVQNEKMATVGNLAAGMAHELNNPLGIILQGLQNMVNRLDPGNETNRRTALECDTSMEAIHVYFGKRKIDRYLQGIHEAGERASDIIISMLQFTRKSEVKKNAENINSLMDNAIEFLASDYNFRIKYDFKKINIQREYDNDMAPYPCVKTEIEQVFLNIVKNAAQSFTAANDEGLHPSIHIKTAALHSCIRISITDNGPGMESETVQHIFDPFFSTKSVGLGTGLGLSVSYFIITEKHGGTLRALSEPGKGTTFIIELPL